MNLALPHWGWVMHICVGKLAIIGSDNGLSPGLNQCWTNAVYWTIRNKLQWDLNRNSCIFIQENAFKNVVWKMATILSRPQCVNDMSIVVPVMVQNCQAPSHYLNQCWRRSIMPYGITQPHWVKHCSRQIFYEDTASIMLLFVLEHKINP